MSEKMPAAFANWYECWWQNEPNAIAKANAHAAFFAGWDACVAAQGAAPQAESAPKSSYISPSLPGMIRNLWKSDPSENSVRTALKLAGDLIQELIDLRAASVLPSSTVDEAALIREAKAEAWDEGYGWRGITTEYRNPYREGSET